MAHKAVNEPGNSLHADFPALEGPMRRILRVGRESSEAMVTEQGITKCQAKLGEVHVDCGKILGGHVSFWSSRAVGNACGQGKMM